MAFNQLSADYVVTKDNGPEEEKVTE